MHPLLRLPLMPLSLLWAMVAWLRGKLFDWGVLPSRSFPLPVICVGNLAVGGTGKTPHVEHLLRLLHAEGYRVAMLSRGYGRRTKGFRLARPGHTAAHIGDEPLQMMRNCPFATIAVCESRVEGMRRLLELPDAPQVVVLDDAYQHRYVRAGLNILLTEASRLYTTDHLLPWGRLREPASAARRAQAVVVTKCRSGQWPDLKVAPGQLLYYSRIAYGALLGWCGDAGRVSQDMRGARVLLLTGIARPEPLRRHLLESGAAEVRCLSFPDHHAFDRRDAARINRSFAQLPGACVVTTQKDAVRLQAIAPHLDAALLARLYVQPITVELSASPQAAAGSPTFNQMILQYVASHSRNRCMD